MLLSDVKIIYRGEIEEEDDSPGFSYTDIVFEIFERNVEETEITDIVVGSRKESQSEDGTGIEWTRGMLRLAVIFHDRLSSEIKDGISFKLASAVRALKSRISRICGINELMKDGQCLVV